MPLQITCLLNGRETPICINMINVLYKDKFIIICEKPVNILSEQQTNTKRTMPDILKKMSGAYKVDTIHRLDKMVGGTMVYSISSKATSVLSKMVRDHKIVKEYLAVVTGKPEEQSGEMCDILFKDSKQGKSFVIKSMRKGAKDAKLEYETIATKDNNGTEVSLVKVRLHTGRTHQIRVQFSHRKMPLLGDGKYGSHDNGCFIALWSNHLKFDHPIKREVMDQYSFPPVNQYPWKLFKVEIDNLKEKAYDLQES